MKKSELVKIIQAARTFNENSLQWFAYGYDAEEHGDQSYAHTAYEISKEYENKMRGLFYAIEITTGFTFGQWYFEDFTNEALAEMVMCFQSTGTVQLAKKL